MVFCLKYRYRILRDDISGYTRHLIYKFCSYKELVKVLELNILEDHVHLVLSIPPKYAISSLMGCLATKLFQRYERDGNRYWGRHLWSRV
ncbi:MAG: IS200/IS605 family transposase [Nitrospirota bacterium]